MEQKGVTLIELLVVLVISAILVALIYRVLIYQHHTYVIQEQVVEMQQNVRAAIHQVMREIRMAGFGNISMVLPVTFGAKTFDHIINPDLPARGAFTLVSAIGGTAALKDIPSSNKITVNTLYHNSTKIFDKDKKKYISLGGLESFCITDIEGNTLSLNKKIIHSYKTDGTTSVFAIRAISYEVVKENGKFILKRDENTGGGRQPFVENIERITFGYLDGDGNPIDLNHQTNLPNIRTIRVTVTSKTEEPDPDQKFKGDDGTGHRTRTITSAIHLRNMGLNQ